VNREVGQRGVERSKWEAENGYGNEVGPSE